jgi:hypothetical protein
MSKARQRIVFGLLSCVLGAALFLIASAYVIDHDHGKILATAVGAFAFPVAPIAWHLVSERRRRTRIAAAKAPPKTTLTGFDRYWMRFVVVALVVLGPMVAASRSAVLGAVWRHPLWFWPETPANMAKDAAPLLKRVPGDAELVVVIHTPADDHKAAGSAVFAWGNKQLMAALDDSLADMQKDHVKGLEELNADRDKVPWLPFDKVSEVSTSDKTVVIASEGWKTKVDPPGIGPSEELLGELARAPQDAVFVAAFTPRTKLTPKDLDPAMIRHGVVWATGNDKQFVIAGRLEATSVEAATTLAGELDAVLHLKTADIPEKCRDDVSKLVEHLQLEHTGTIITARLEVAPEQLVGLMFCAMK